MSSIRIPSLLAPEVRCYVLLSDTMELWDQAYHFRSHFLARWLGYYATYGDGMTAHGPTCLVGTELAEDALASVASEALAKPEVAKVLSEVWNRPRSLSAESIRFAADLRPALEGKPSRYYSASLRKVSAAPKLHYDTRYKPVPEWADGSVSSVVNMLTEPRRTDGLLQRLVEYEWARDVLHGGDGDYHAVDYYAEALSVRSMSSETSRLSQVFEACQCLVDSEWKHTSAARQIACWKGNRERAAERAAKEEEAA